MAISSNSLYHFTNTIKNLEGIIENGFMPRYSLEDIKIKHIHLEIPFPMVCFCDIPLSKISKHLDVYGYYGVGLSMNWAVKNRLNPIFYLDSNSQSAQTIMDVMMRLNSLGNDLKLEFTTGRNDVFFEIKQLLRYIKPFRDDFKRKGKILKNYKFYDEREWRYVLSYEDNFNRLQLDFKKYTNKKILETENKIISAKSLIFDAGDVNYLIVKHDNQIPSLIKSITKMDRFTDNEKSTLMTRVISAERIKTDF
ncbi:abortive infection system antitoxin AbiGi family protein [Jiulongibacter sediminis]|uniref:Uncharacterized protein n=1 Tax=Jiulongibacter sediminis TaxID=1605367 RepID=A0A0P7C3P3_9BACT|nr:abortive infection system antitoxin AbiGi family protein [Jiulongibacter sediminis]KPM49265.1 hypothetical protein AFM12_01155 [Jiulongibacter sediminis]TBX26320.1 hypothetical protein TK44_01155 [Jiulongibacter sediminis]